MEEQQQQPSTTISIQVPPDASPGDILTFVVNGQELELTLPEGSAPGNVLEIQVGGSSADDVDDVDSAITTIPLETSGKSLVLHIALPVDDETEAASHDDNDCDGTFAMPWPAGLELVRYLDQDHGKCLSSPCHRVLELGSGLGLVGLCFASTCCSSSDDTKSKTQVVLTDCPSAMPLLQYNVEQNRDNIPPNVTVTTQPLRWEEESSKSTMEPFDLILGSDLLYNVSAIDSLIETIQRHVHPSRGNIVLAVRWRKPDLERRFFQMLSHQFYWKLLWGCPLSWKEYGNPSNEDSNRYFRQTLVSVQGKPMALADITESDMERMTQEESKAWDRAQIQIYMGIRKQVES